MSNEPQTYAPQIYSPQKAYPQQRTHTPQQPTHQPNYPPQQPTHQQLTHTLPQQPTHQPNYPPQQPNYPPQQPTQHYATQQQTQTHYQTHYYTDDQPHSHTTQQTHYHTEQTYYTTTPTLAASQHTTTSYVVDPGHHYDTLKGVAAGAALSWFIPGIGTIAGGIIGGAVGHYKKKKHQGQVVQGTRYPKGLRVYRTHLWN